MSEQAPGQSLPGPVQRTRGNVTQNHGAQNNATPTHGALRIAGLVAVGVGLAALAGAAFVLSYAGIHAVALQAGVSHRMARGYPLILDVLLVVIVAAVLALRGAGWPSKLLAWASLLALLAAAAGADALHAAGKRLPTRPAAVTAAILPWALVLIAFVLLLAMLRHARLRRLAQAVAAERGEAPKAVKWQPLEPPPLSMQPLVPGFPARSGAAAPTPAPTAAAPTAAGPEPAALPGRDLNDTLRLAVPRQAEPDWDSQEPGHPDLAIDAELAPDDPGTDEAAPVATAAEPGYLESLADQEVRDESPARADSADGPEDGSPDDAADSAMDDAAPDYAAAEDAVAEDAVADDAAAPDPSSEAVAAAASGDPAPADPEMPVFHRMWSAPVPPSEDRL
jgi:TRAP-type C4-dicarboxylate transport system permease small subunit